MRNRKNFSWSYTNLRDFETCPRKWAEAKFYRRYKDEVSEAGEWGFRAHEQLAALLTQKEEPKEIPPSLKSVERIVRELRSIPYRLRFVESKWAFDKDMVLLKDFFDRSAWFRAVLDAGYVMENCKDAVIVDWKTGKPKDDDSQLMVFAKALISVVPYPIERVHAGYAWLQTGKLTRATFTRDEIERWWENDLMVRVARMELACREEDFPARPCGLCGKWCPVTVEHCEFGRPS